MLDKNKSVQGCVVYAEFHRVNETRQVFFTPDGYTTAGALVPMRAYNRTIAASYPRRPWRTTVTNVRDIRAVLEAHDRGDEYSLDIFTSSWARERLSIVGRYFDDLISHSWESVGTPLVVEASKHDMDDVAALRTPTKIIYRINQSRIAAAFPAELF